MQNPKTRSAVKEARELISLALLTTRSDNSMPNAYAVVQNAFALRPGSFNSVVRIAGTLRIGRNHLASQSVVVFRLGKKHYHLVRVQDK